MVPGHIDSLETCQHLQSNCCACLLSPLALFAQPNPVTVIATANVTALQVVTHPAEAAAKGRAARAHVLANFTPDVLARVIMREVMRIQEKLGPDLKLPTAEERAARQQSAALCSAYPHLCRQGERRVQTEQLVAAQTAATCALVLKVYACTETRTKFLGNAAFDRDGSCMSALNAAGMVQCVQVQGVMSRNSPMAQRIPTTLLL